mgnify:CR=1 FL=1
MNINYHKLCLEEISKLKYISIEELGHLIDQKDPNVTFSNQQYILQ